MIFKIYLGECLESFFPPTLLQMEKSHLQAQGDLEVMQMEGKKSD